MTQLLSPAVEPARSSTPLYAPIAREMEEVERLLEQSVQSDDAGISELVGHVSHYRGKRLRPALLLLTGRAAGRLTPAHPVLAAVIELIHTATLVHDDVLDGATIRRHVETV